MGRKCINYFLLISLSAITLSSCTKVVKLRELVVKNNLFYKINDKEPFTGKIQETYISGKDSLIALLSNGMFNKSYLVYYPNGEIKDSIFYEKGIIVKYREFLPNGKIRNHAKKSLIESKEGIFLIKDKQNNIIPFSGQALDTFYLSIGSTFDKRKVYMDTMGLSLTCKGNIFLVVEDYINGKLDGDNIIYYPNGKIYVFSKYVKGHIEGRYNEYYDNGMLKYESYNKNGLDEGKCLSYYKNKQVKEVGDYKKGRKDSTWNEYYQNGKIKEVSNYLNGSLNGSYIDYYENGKIKKSENYLNGLLNGKSIEYFENGRIKARGNYKNDLADGDWIWYYPSGRVENQGRFRNGKILRRCDCCGRYYNYAEGWSSRNPGFTRGAWDYFADGGAGGGPYCSKGCARRCE